MTAYAVLLRGVNVGGVKLPMATLRTVLFDLGYGEVRSYLQSGNAVLTSSAAAKDVAERTQQALSAAMGRDVEVVVRTARQLAAIAERWPFDEDGPPTAKHVVFLRSKADAARLAGLPLDELLPERLHIAGTEIYLWVPGGLGRSKLAALLAAKQKGTAATTRNWNTVTALRDLTASLPS